MTCSTASNNGKFACSGVGIGEGTTLKGITFRLSDFFFNKGLEHESGFFIATPCIHLSIWIAHFVHMKESCDNMDFLLKAPSYSEYK